MQISINRSGETTGELYKLYRDSMSKIVCFIYFYLFFVDNFMLFLEYFC